MERLRRLLRRLARMMGESSTLFQRWILVASSVVILFFVGLILFSPIIEVRAIKIRRSDVRIDAESAQRALAPIFGRHLLFVSSQHVRDLLEGALPDVTAVQLEKDYPSKLTINVRLEPVIARLHIDSPDEKDRDASVTQSGSSVPTAPMTDVLTSVGRFISQQTTDALSGLPEIRIVDWGVRPSPGEIILPIDLLDAVGRAEHSLSEEFGFTVTGRTVFLRARDIHLHTDKRTFWFDLESTVDEALARLKIFLKTVALTEVKEYVDLRLSDRVVYQ